MEVFHLKASTLDEVDDGDDILSDEFWREPSAKDLRRAMKACGHSAAGTDGWRADELMIIRDPTKEVV